MKLVTIEEMQQLERAADANGHSFATMMEQAGRAVSVEIASRIAVKSRVALVLVGPGNNGGDGLVAARHLKEAGAQILCYLWKPRPADDPNLILAQERSIPCLCSADDKGHKTLRKALNSADIIVDALLGTGASRPIEGMLKDLLDTVREIVSERRLAQTRSLAFVPPHRLQTYRPPFVVAVDVPSGLDCDSGAVDPAALAADLTVTFAAPKRGQFRFPGAAMLGELVVADIGIDPALAQNLPIDVPAAQDVARRLPARPLDAHKGTFGKAMIVAGSINYTGAPYLAAAAAARVGAGLVTLAPPQPLYPVLSGKLTEATFVLLAHSMGVLNEGAVKTLAESLPGYAALLVGPGLGQEKETIAFVHRLLGIGEKSSRPIGFRQTQHTEPGGPIALPPLVIDADGLNALAHVEKWWQHIPANSILTPHPGEMTRLMNSQAKIADRLATTTEKAAEWNQVLVLKGAHTVIAAPDGRTAVLPFANPGLATAGTGDVLAGCIVGLLAQGLAPFDAALCGAYLHALAGERVVAKMGHTGTLASDLLPELPTVIASLR
ncbi:MAG: NAD(P)H-hydrate dehydratase [Anaerolineae bacterium]|nr:NAD(P)H-hydrate dehydratase [Anaerolineae bacterium]